MEIGELSYSKASLGIILVCLPWLALLGWMASVSWFLTDDAFISFRYARNLLEGHGLVFNPGERVEGYSNFLWVLELAAVWRALGVPPEDAAPWLSVAFTRRNGRRAGMVDISPALAAKPGTGRLDGAGAGVQQRDLRGVDIGRRAGNAAAHVLHRAGSRLPEPIPRRASGPAGGVSEPDRSRPDSTGRAADCAVLLRLARRPADGRRQAADGELARADVSGGALRHRGDCPPPVSLRLLWRVAAQHLLRQARPPVVRVGLPLPVDGGAGDGAVPADSPSLGRSAASVAGDPRRDLCSGPAASRRPHGIRDADWRRPLRVSPAGFLLAAAGAAGSRGDRVHRLADRRLRTGGAYPTPTDSGGRERGLARSSCSSPSSSTAARYRQRYSSRAPRSTCAS